MTLNDIKEHMSRNQFKTIANRCGYKCERPADGDHGIDFHVHELQLIQRPQGPRIFDTGRVLPFQLKATTENSVEVNAVAIKYDLEAKTFNDLVERLSTPYPLTLVLTVLPNDDATWLTCPADGIHQFTKLFWYRPPAGTQLTTNKQAKRIVIPLTNRVDLAYLDAQFTELFA